MEPQSYDLNDGFYHKHYGEEEINILCSLFHPAMKVFLKYGENSKFSRAQVSMTRVSLTNYLTRFLLITVHGTWILSQLLQVFPDGCTYS